MGRPVMSLVICDTNIFISAFNGLEKTIAEISRIGSENILMPSITVMELYRGMANKEQMAKMVRKIRAYNILDFNEQVSQRAIEFIQMFKLSHDLQIPDAIIAALSVNYELPLFTYNIKDFKFIPGLKLHEPAT
jgi:predicted nucleic acid-binding protein